MISEQDDQRSPTGGAHFRSVLSVAVTGKGRVYIRLELLSK